MRTYGYTLGGLDGTIYVPEREEDIDAFFDWYTRDAPELVGLDTETTGLDVYSPGFACRTVQFGDTRTGWVLRAEQFFEVIVWALRDPRHRFTLHNFGFDGHVLDHCFGVTIEELAQRVIDSRINAHLVDPRQVKEGGTGHKLKELAKRYIDRNASDGHTELMAEFRKIGATKDTGWAKINIDNPVYEFYAGLDPILAARLTEALDVAMRGHVPEHLSTFEHTLQVVLMKMQRRGFRIDVPYAAQLRDELTIEAEHFAKVAARYGVENVNSTKQLSEALTAMGERLTEKTDSGAFKVDKEVLQDLADVDKDWKARESRKPNRLADAVLRSKRAAKWATAYAGAFIDLKDSDDRLHAVIGGLQARTARMSISHPPLQQLPSSDWRIRRAMIADPGQVIIAADYSQVEMRVLAALCRDETLLEAVRSGQDLHDFTASKVFGPDFTKKQRKLSKGIGFGKVYGGGLTTIQRQTGAPREQVKEALDAYDSTFPGIKAFGRVLQQRTQYGALPIVTPSGRKLPLDRDRTYAATNYIVQSTARDLLAQALVDIDEKGLGEHLLLPVHDEVIAQAPEKDAAEVIRAIGDCMDSEFIGVPIISDPEVYGHSWGHGSDYGMPEAKR